MAKGDLDKSKKIKENVEKTTASEKEKLNTQKQQESLLQKVLDLQSESLDISSAIVDSMKEVLGINTKRTTADANLLKVNKEINRTILNQQAGVTSIAEKNKQIAKNQKVLNKAQQLELGLANKITTERKQHVQKVADVTIELDKNLRQQEGLLEAAAKGEKIDQKVLKALEDKISSGAFALDQQMDGLSLDEKKLLNSKVNIDLLEKQNDQRKIELGLAKEIEKKLGVAGGLTEMLGAIPGIGKYASSALADVTKELEEAADNGEKLPSNLKVMGKVVGKVGANIVKAFGPLALAVMAIKTIVDALKGIDKEAGEVAKQFGISYENAKEFGHEMNQVAMFSKDILVDQHGLMEAQKKLNSYFHTAGKFSGEIAEQFTSIQKRTGLSDKAMGMFMKKTMKTGKPVKSILKDIHATVLEQNQQNKLSLSVKEIQEEIANTSAAIYLSTKGNVKELVNSVVAAKKLGTNLEGVENMASSLLDFESSIQAEMQAELLLGKKINLEQARLYALKGKTKKVAEEIMKNEEIFNAFKTDNVLVQEAAAQAIGIGREELAKMIKNQETLSTLQKAYGKDITSMSDAQKKYNDLRAGGMSAEEAGLKVGDESLAQQLESTSNAEKFEASTARLKTMFAELAEKILPVIETIMNGIVTAVQGFVKGLQEGNPLAYALVGILSALAVKSIITAVASIWTGLGKLGLFGIAAAGVATGVLYNNIAKAETMEDGIIGPGGEMVVSGPKGSIQLNKDDSIIAGTNLGGGNTNSQNNTQLLTVMKEVLMSNKQIVAINKQIAAKSPVLELAGDKVGNGVEQESREIQ